MSLRSNHAALADVLVAFPVTLQLALAALALAVVIGVPVGVVAATRPSGLLDNLLMTATLFGVSMPIFWLGLMLLLVFGGLARLAADRRTDADRARRAARHRHDGDRQPDQRPASTSSGRACSYLMLPAVTLATIPLAMIARITRSEMLAMASLDHVRTARAKGMPERRVILRHILRNALIPVVTVIGLQLGPSALGRCADRDDLRAAGARPADGRQHPVARLSGGAGRRALRRPGVRPRQPGRSISPTACSIRGSAARDAPKPSRSSPRPASPWVCGGCCGGLRPGSVC